MLRKKATAQKHIILKIKLENDKTKYKEILKETGLVAQ